LELAAAGGVELYQAILALLSAEQGADPAALHALADRLSRGEADDAYRAVEGLLSYLLAEIAVCAAGGNSGHQPCQEANLICRRLGARAPAARWAELRERVETIFARRAALNLDRKQTILTAFFAIERLAR
jgi:DNA polymerase-3 subunit delta'